MSIENAILELAAAIHYLGDQPAHAATVTVNAPAKPSAAKAAIQEALAKARTDKEAHEAAAAAQAKKEEDDLLGDGGEVVELDYEKDVKPLLVQVGKDKQQLVELLGKFNAKNGAGIAKTDYPAVVAAANAIIGG